jgi:hypothetical protein
LIDHKISQCWKNASSLFSLALLAKHFAAKKTIGLLLVVHKNSDFKQPHPHYLDIRWHKLYSSPQLKRHTIPYD